MDEGECQLLRREGLAFFGSIVAGQSHEVTNVLSVINELAGLQGDILGNAGAGQPPDIERLKQVVQKIRNQVQRGEIIIRSINRFAHTVDDSAAIRKILQRVLHQAEVPLGNVYEAGDGREALASLQEATPGLVLSDINMPNMDGLEFLRNVKANAAWKDLPVVMVTTEGSKTKVMEAVELGAVGYVRKPFTAEQIKEKLAGLY